MEGGAAFIYMFSVVVMLLCCRPTFVEHLGWLAGNKQDPDGLISIEMGGPGTIYSHPAQESDPNLWDDIEHKPDSGIRFSCPKCLMYTFRSIEAVQTHANSHGKKCVEKLTA
jgi:hypothetical protein